MSETKMKPFRLDEESQRMLAEMAKNNETTETDIIKAAIENLYNGGPSATDRTLKIYNLVSDQIQELERMRDYTRPYNEEETELYLFLNKTWDGLRSLKSFWEPSYPEAEH